MTAPALVVFPWPLPEPRTERLTAGAAFVPDAPAPAAESLPATTAVPLVHDAATPRSATRPDELLAAFVTTRLWGSIFRRRAAQLETTSAPGLDDAG